MTPRAFISRHRIAKQPVKLTPRQHEQKIAKADLPGLGRQAHDTRDLLPPSASQKDNQPVFFWILQPPVMFPTPRGMEMVFELFSNHLNKIIHEQLSIPELISVADQLIHHQESNLAIALYRAWLHYHKNIREHYVAYFNMGVIHYNMKNFASAQDSWSEAIKNQPYFMQSYLNQAKLLEKHRQRHDALKCLKDAAGKLAELNKINNTQEHLHEVIYAEINRLECISQRTYFPFDPIPTQEFSSQVMLSPPYPCGVYAVMDMLLHLDIMTISTGSQFATWEKLPDGFQLTKNAVEANLNNCVTVDKNRKFSFSDKKCFIADHTLSLLGYPADNHILVVRDPVDACYSSYRRKTKLYSDFLSFDAFLEKIMYHRFTPYRGWALRPLDYYALFILFCISAYRDIHIIRYEDLKNNPASEIKKLLNVIRCHRTDEEIAAAVELPLFDSIKGNYHNARAQPNEWKERMTQDEHDRLLADEPIHYVCRLLSYTSSEHSLDLFKFPSTIHADLMAWSEEYTQTIGETVHVNRFVQDCRHFLFGGNVWQTVHSVWGFHSCELQALDALLATANLLEAVFKEEPVQSTDTLIRILLQISSVFAHCADTGKFRKFYEGIPSITNSSDVSISPHIS